MLTFIMKNKSYAKRKEKKSCKSIYIINVLKEYNSVRIVLFFKEKYICKKYIKNEMKK